MIAGKLVQSVTLPPRANGKCTCSGVAISPDGRFCAVSSMESSLVTYTMPDFTTVHEWEEGRGPGQVKAPWKLCFTPGGNLLVVEDGNSRVQELLVTGEHVRFVGLGILGPDVRGIDANEETIAVSYGYSSTDLTLALFSAVNGSHVRSCSLYDDAETSLSCCYSVRLIQAGRGVLITDFGRDMVFEFTLGGTFVRLAAGDPLRSPQDSVMCLNGEVIVADKELKCLCVFGPTGVEVRSFSPDGAFSPAALALHDGRLFVVETNSTVLRVYE